MGIMCKQEKSASIQDVKYGGVSPATAISLYNAACGGQLGCDTIWLQFKSPIKF